MNFFMNNIEAFEVLIGDNPTNLPFSFTTFEECIDDTGAAYKFTKWYEVTSCPEYLIDKYGSCNNAI